MYSKKWVWNINSKWYNTNSNNIITYAQVLI